MSSPLFQPGPRTSAHLSSIRWCAWSSCVIIISGVGPVEMKACFGTIFHNSNFAARSGSPALWRWWHLRELLRGLSRVLSGLSDIWQAMRTMTAAGDWPRAGRPAVPTRPSRSSQPPSHLDPLPRMRCKDRHNSATKFRRNLFQNRKRIIFWIAKSEIGLERIRRIFSNLEIKTGSRYLPHPRQTKTLSDTRQFRSDRFMTRVLLHSLPHCAAPVYICFCTL
jgi:hypothetical protein